MRASILILLVSLSYIGFTNAFAKVLNLYAEPKDNAKIVATIDSGLGIITIFTPKESEWIKVADPKNGNVGWIKSQDLNGGTQFSFKIMTKGDNNAGYQIIESNMTPYQTTQLKGFIKEMRERQQKLQKDMQKLMDEMTADFNKNWMNFPMIMPVIVVPEKTTPPFKSNATTHNNNEKLKSTTTSTTTH